METAMKDWVSWVFIILAAAIAFYIIVIQGVFG